MDDGLPGGARGANRRGACSYLIEPRAGSSARVAAVSAAASDSALTPLPGVHNCLRALAFDKSFAPLAR